MAKPFSHINLIQSKRKGSVQLEAIEQSLRKAALISLLLFIALGSLVASVFIFFTFQRNTLEKEHLELIRFINISKNKEGLLLSIKDRTNIVSSVLANQHPWSVALDGLSTVAVPPALTNISADEQNNMIVVFEADTLDGVLEPISRLVEMAQTGKIANPELASIQLNKNGSVAITVTLVTLFK